MSIAPVPTRTADGNTPGDELRRARDAQGLSLEDMSRLTKISLSKLTAIERNDLDKLPGDVYVRGFLRAYAREVDLDPEETVQRYFAHAEAQQQRYAVTAPAPGVTIATLNAHASAPHAVAHDGGAPRRSLTPSVARSPWVMATIALIGLIAYIAFSRTHSPTQANVGAPAAPISDATPAANAGAAADQVATASSAVPDVLQFELQPQGPCWISANADGEPVVSRLLQAGERQTIQVREELVMRVGDPGAVTMSINGQAGRPLGRAGEPVNVRITKENFRDFLSS